jgi:hypothetical protein
MLDFVIRKIFIFHFFLVFAGRRVRNLESNGVLTAIEEFTNGKREQISQIQNCQTSKENADYNSTHGI